MKKIAIGVGVFALLLALAAPFVFAPSDKDLISEALKESIKASREGRPGGVMEYLSGSLKYNQESVSDRGSVADYIKMARPDVIVEDPRPTITGDTATITSPVTVSMEVGPMSFPMRIERAVITFSKETGRKYLILPAPVWRITSISAPEVDMSQLANY